MSTRSFLQSLAVAVVGYFEQLQEWLGADLSRDALIRDLGGTPGANRGDPPTFPTARLDAIKAYRDAADPDKAADLAVLADVVALLDAVAGIVETWGFDVDEAEEVGHALLQLSGSNYVRLRWPRLFLLLQAVSAIEEKTSTFGAGTNNVVRLGSSARALFDFLVDPGKTLEALDPDAPADLDRASVDLAVDTLLRLGAVVLAVLDSVSDVELVGDVLAGWDAPGLDVAVPARPRIADVLSTRMLSASVVHDPAGPASAPDLAERLQLSLAYVPKHQGGRQLFLALGGALTLDAPVSDRWRISARIRSDASVGMLIGHDSDLSGPAGDTAFRAGVAFSSVPDPASELSYAIPRPTGTRVEIGRLGAAAGVDATEASIRVTIADAALVVDSADADGLVRRLLGGTPLRLPFELTVGYGSEQGLILEGHAPRNPLSDEPSPTPDPEPATGAAARLAGPAPIGQPTIAATLPVGRRIGPVTVADIGLAVARTSSGVAQSDGTVPDDDVVHVRVETSISAKLGPAYLRLDKMGLQLTVDGSVPPGQRNLRLLDAHLDATMPAAISLSIDTTSVSGGGTLYRDPAAGSYFGVFALRLGKRFTLKAIGLVATRQPDGSAGFSFIVIATLEGLGWQLGPITLNGLGLLYASERTFADDAVRAALPTGQLRHLLFPADPVHHAAEILAPLASFFPAQRDSYLFGILVQLTFGRPPKIRLDLALIYQWGDSVSDRMLVLGRLSSILPDDKVRAVTLNLDAVGVFDPSEGVASLDAVLVDSKLCGRFPLTGSAALRRVPGPSAFALAVGGFHPRFPVPPGFPALKRVTVALTAGENPKLICSAYLAVTANTVQFGAEASLYASACGFSLEGHVGFDVLIQLWPPHFLAEFRASVQLKRGSKNLFKVSVSGALEGPLPLRIAGRASFEILWWDYSVDFDKTLVGGSSPTTLPLADAVAELETGLSDPRAWQAELPDAASRLVSVRRDERASAVLLHPMGTLTVTQGVVPLNLDRDIDRIGGATPSAARRFAITAVELDGRPQQPRTVTDEFAAGQYFDLTDDEALAAPSFEQMDAGISFGADEYTFPFAARLSSPFDYTDVTVGADGVPVVQPEPARAAGPTVRVLAQFGAAAAPVRREVGRRFASTADPQAPTLRAQGWGVADVASTAQPSVVRTWAEARRRLQDSGLGDGQVLVPAVSGGEG